MFEVIDGVEIPLLFSERVIVYIWVYLIPYRSVSSLDLRVLTLIYSSHLDGVVWIAQKSSDEMLIRTHPSIWLRVNEFNLLLQKPSCIFHLNINLNYVQLFDQMDYGFLRIHFEQMNLLIKLRT